MTPQSHGIARADELLGVMHDMAADVLSERGEKAEEAFWERLEAVFRERERKAELARLQEAIGQRHFSPAAQDLIRRRRFALAMSRDDLEAEAARIYMAQNADDPTDIFFGTVQQIEERELARASRRAGISPESP